MNVFHAGMGRLVERVVKPSLERLRAFPVVNAAATLPTRRVLRVLRLQSEFLVKHLHRVGTVRETLPNGRTLRLWSRGDDWISNQIFWRGWSGYEPETSCLFFHLAATARVTLDVGAYVGYYAILAAQANQSGRVFAFEPHPGVFARLRHNVALNHVPNVECVASAAGEDDGEADFFHSGSDPLPSSSGLSVEFTRAYPHFAKTPVRVVSIDRFLAKRGVQGVDLVKLDTEGTEPSVLRGMAATLEHHRPHLVCELLAWSGTARDLDDILGRFGYRYYHLTSSGPVPTARLVAHPSQRNLLFTRLKPGEVRDLWRRCATS